MSHKTTAVVLVFPCVTLIQLKHICNVFPPTSVSRTTWAIICAFRCWGGTEWAIIRAFRCSGGTAWAIWCAFRCRGGFNIADITSKLGGTAIIKGGRVALQKSIGDDSDEDPVDEDADPASSAPGSLSSWITGGGND